MRIFTAPPTFGYEYSNTSASKTRRSLPKLRQIGSNFCKFIGYIPILGSVVGVGRIADAILKNHPNVSSPKTHLLGRVGRGVVEAFSLGLVFLPIDVVVSLVRHFSSEKERVQSSEKEGVQSSSKITVFFFNECASRWKIPEDVQKELPSGNYICIHTRTYSSPGAQEIEQWSKSDAKIPNNGYPTYIIFFALTDLSDAPEEREEFNYTIKGVECPHLQINVYAAPNFATPELNVQRAKNFKAKVEASARFKND